MDALRAAGFDGWIVDDFDYTGYRHMTPAQPASSI
jgi:hypothetical protein